MGIEISNNGRTALEALETAKSQASQQTTTARSGGNTAKTPNATGDEVRLSSQASQLQALESEIANLPVVDTQRVQDVQRTLATGSFEVQPARVADKMLQFEAGLGQNS